MADPYLEPIESVVLSLLSARQKVTFSAILEGLRATGYSDCTPESLILSLDNGLLKGYWQFTLNPAVDR